MGDAVGQMLASAVGIALSPLPLIAVVLMLATPQGRANGGSFALGWITALAAVVTVAVLAGAGAGASGSGGPAVWTLWTKLVLGVLFLLMAVKQWKSRPRQSRGAEETPRWMRAIDTFTPARAAGLAAALAVANPKNLVLAAGGALSIAGSSAAAGGRATAAVLMVLIASLPALLPLGVHLLGGSASTRILSEWKSWMGEHNAAIMVTLLVVLGAKYTGDAVSGLTG
ncbi:GAP family protein [Streptomyces enissocaesilis]|uniref:GAP family protein n=1 Tax=Streptomyces enissocaesilis TaxID=332589 RepID=A0ABN3X7W5_9ACTN